MKLENLNDLFVEQLKDLYSAEKQLIEALPKMAKKATSPKLKKAFESHLEETEGQLERLEQIFESLDKKPGGHTCKAMKGLIAES
jgi:ferritin-like metal-binding protein YciE